MVVPISISGRAELGSTSLFLELPGAPYPLSLLSQRCHQCEQIDLGHRWLCCRAATRSMGQPLAPGRAPMAALAGGHGPPGGCRGCGFVPVLLGRLRESLRTRGGTDGWMDRQTARLAWRSGASCRECPWLWEYLSSRKPPISASQRCGENIGL